MAALPPALRAGVEALLEGVSRGDLARRAHAMSQAYRASDDTTSAIRDDADVAAYLTARMPATFAAVATALSEVAALLPELTPQDVLDICAGPGTASFAAAATWPGLAAVTMVDHSRPFVDVARRLAAGGLPGSQRVEFACGKVPGALAGLGEADLVIIAYALVELAAPEAISLAEQAWQRCRSVLVLVEPGSREGFRRILACRDELLRHGAHAVAPCPHEAPCPLPEPDWCHFSKRLMRSRDHRIVKAASLPFEDEKYSYVALSRSPPAVRPAARVLRPPRCSKASWEGLLCTRGGAAIRHDVPRRAPVHARWRKLGWGDAIFEER